MVIKSGDSHDKRLISGSLAILGFIVIAKLVALVKEVLVAQRYGTSPIIDAYQFVFNMMSAPISIWYTAIFTVLTPLIINMRFQNDDGEIKLKNEFLTVSLIFGISIGIVYGIFIYYSIFFDIFRLSPIVKSSALLFSEFMWLIVPLFFLISYGSTLLMTSRNYVNNFLESLPSLGILICLAFLIGKAEVPLLAGTIFGSIMQLVLTFFIIGRSEPIPKIVRHFSAPQWAAVRPALLTILFSVFLQSLVGIVDQLFAAWLPQGSLSTFGYATRISGLFLALISTTIGRAVLPVFSSMAAENASDLLRASIKWAGIMFLIGFIVAIALYLFANPIVKILFERGAFLPSDTKNVAELLGFLAIQIPLLLVAQIFMQNLSARADYARLLRLGVGSLLVKLAAAAWLTAAYGLNGLALSTSVVLLFQIAYLGNSLRSAPIESKVER